MALRFIALSGTTDVTENLYVYEYGNDMMIIDCGVGFPDLEMHGVDLVIPDFSYIKKNQQKLRGILISQGHDDHHGALPFLLKELKRIPPIYAAKLPAEFIKDNLEDHGVRRFNVNVFDPDRDVVKIGSSFNVTPFRVTHSVPDTMGFVIDTPEGRVFHVAEHKFDPNPVIGKPVDIQKASVMAKKGVLFLASDCLGSNQPGSAEPEGGIQANLEKVMGGAKRGILFTTISSNIGRIQQAFNVAQKLSRKVALVGHSIQRKSQIARDLGYLKYPSNIEVSIKQSAKVDRDKIMFIVAGCYGQVGSSLFRIATKEHDRVWLEKDDLVVFSANPAPPYTKESEDFVVDNLIDQGAEVYYYDNSEGLYVSGHGHQADIVRMFDIVKPKYFIPLGGTIRFMHGYKKLVRKFGRKMSSVYDLKPGESVIFEGGNARNGEKIPVKNVYVDGLGIGDVGKVVLEDRKTLSQHGVAIAIIELDTNKNKLAKDPEIISRGFVFQKGEKEFLIDSAKRLRQSLESHPQLDVRKAKYLSVEFLADLFFRDTGRRPMILPVVVEV